VAAAKRHGKTRRNESCSGDGQRRGGAALANCSARMAANKRRQATWHGISSVERRGGGGIAGMRRGSA